MAINPVQRRLAELLQHWQAFVDQPDKRLLLWQVPDNARRVVHGFFEAQRHDAPPDATDAATYVGTDTFIVFDAPFENSIRYARALKAAYDIVDPAERNAALAKVRETYGNVSTSKTLATFG